MAVSNAETLAEMKRYLDMTGALICPHTAVGTYVAHHLVKEGVTTVTLSTAHAAKFPETVKDATGWDAPLPKRCAGLIERGEVFSEVPADAAAVKSFVLSRLRV